MESLWQPGDCLRLELPFELALQRFPKGGISLDYGPLTFSLPRVAYVVAAVALVTTAKVKIGKNESIAAEGLPELESEV